MKRFQSTVSLKIDLADVLSGSAYISCVKSHYGLICTTMSSKYENHLRSICSMWKRLMPDLSNGKHSVMRILLRRPWMRISRWKHILHRHGLLNFVFCFIILTCVLRKVLKYSNAISRSVTMHLWACWGSFRLSLRSSEARILHGIAQWSMFLLLACQLNTINNANNNWHRKFSKVCNRNCRTGWKSWREQGLYSVQVIIYRNSSDPW